jgi:hypothetical protein
MTQDDDRLRRIELDVAEIKGKLSTMPTMLQIAAWFSGTALGLSGLVFAIARLAH